MISPRQRGPASWATAPRRRCQRYSAKLRCGTARVLLDTIALLMVVCFAGCGPAERKPIPIIEIVILPSPSEYLLQGKRVYDSELPSRLQEISDKYRRSITNDARALVRVYHGSAIPWARVQRVMGLCTQVGLDKITEQTRETSTAPPPPQPASTIPR